MEIHANDSQRQESNSFQNKVQYFESLLSRAYLKINGLTTLMLHKFHK